MKEFLDFLYNEQKELSTFSGIAALLGWDQMTYMPEGGSADRSEHISLISKLAHEKFTSDKLYNYGKKLLEPKVFDSLQQKDKIVVVRLMKDIEKSRKVPSDFVKRMSKASSLAYDAWQQAKKKSMFSIFSPHLEKIVELEKEYCGHINLPGPAYNSLLDDYEEGMTVNRLDRQFHLLRSDLSAILKKIMASSVYEKQQVFDGKLSADKQKKICNFVFDRFGLSRRRARLDVSAHPFTTSLGYDDVRLTTNFERKNPLFSFFSTVHETGHALYELSLPKGEYKDTVISDSPSLGLHESQSRFWENMIARSRPFWKFCLPMVKKIAGGRFSSIDDEEWYRYVNQVRPSLIRVDADELTYCLHVIVRFEIEKALIQEKVIISDLPEVWNEKMDELLGVVPTNDSEGVLQDMHWSGGSFGYFPTYAIGTIYSSQLFDQLKKDCPSICLDIEKGKFEDIISWLHENIYQFGRRLTADEIIQQTCGRGLDSTVFIKYLQEKYYELYEI
ncbi:MAG: carboxypeptidase M32 [Thermoplasmatota archaeon]